MAREDGVGGGKRPQKGLGAFEGMNVWRNAYGGELRWISPFGTLFTDVIVAQSYS